MLFYLSSKSIFFTSCVPFQITVIVNVDVSIENATFNQICLPCVYIPLKDFKRPPFLDQENSGLKFYWMFDTIVFCQIESLKHIGGKDVKEATKNAMLS